MCIGVYHCFLLVSVSFWASFGVSFYRQRTQLRVCSGWVGLILARGVWSNDPVCFIMISGAIKAELIQSAVDMSFRPAALVWAFGLIPRAENCMTALWWTAIPKRIRELRVPLRRRRFFYLILLSGVQETCPCRPIALQQQGLHSWPICALNSDHLRLSLV